MSHTQEKRHRCKQCGDIREGRWVTTGWWCRLCEAMTLKQIEQKARQVIRHAEGRG